MLLKLIWFVPFILGTLAAAQQNDCDYTVNSSVGPQGPTGPTGATGPTGQDGLLGLAGLRGSTGSSGQKGATGLSVTGPTGPTGDRGAEGLQGGPGTTGPAGIDGARGPTGPTGNTGLAGSAGLPGVTGLQGDVGAQGPVGPTGLPGIPGMNGQIGIPGNNFSYFYGFTGATATAVDTLVVAFPLTNVLASADGVFSYDPLTGVLTINVQGQYQVGYVVSVPFTGGVPNIYLEVNGVVEPLSRFGSSYLVTGQSTISTEVIIPVVLSATIRLIVDNTPGSITYQRAGDAESSASLYAIRVRLNP